MIAIDFEKLRPIGLTTLVVNRVAALDVPPDARLMRAIETQRDACVLRGGEREHRARPLPRVVHELHAQADALTVGDWVIAQPDSGGDWWVVQRVAPIAQIARRANDGRRQPLASNVDTALLVMGLDAGFNP